MHAWERASAARACLGARADLNVLLAARRERRQYELKSEPEPTKLNSLQVGTRAYEIKFLANDFGR